MKILVVKTSSLGDVIHCLPAINDVINNTKNISKTTNETLEIDFMVEKSFADIVKESPLINKVIQVEFRKWRKSPIKYLAEFREFKKELRKTKYDLVIDAQGLLKSAFLAKQALRIEGGNIVGFDKLSAREPLATKFYQKSYFVDKNKHAIKRQRELFAKALDYKIPKDLPKFLPKNTDKKQKTIMFLHGTAWESKKYPIKNWRELAKLFIEKDYKIKLLFGNKEEKQTAQLIAKDIENIEVLDRLEISQIIKLFATVAGIISVDTGLAHLAGALEVPLVTIFGATNPNLTAPYNINGVVVGEKLECSPCMKRKCINLQEDSSSCMLRVKPKDVFNGLVDKLEIKKFRFCVVLFNYFPYGGLQKDFHKVTKKLINKSHSVDIVTMDWQGEKIENTNLFILERKKGSSATRNNYFFKQLEKHLKSNNYDCVIGFNKMPFLDVYYVADGCYQAKADNERGFLYKLLRRYRHFKNIEKNLFENIKTKFLMLSKTEADKYAKYYPTSIKNTILLPANVDINKRLEKFDNGLFLQNKNDYNIKGKLVLMVGSGFKTKGVNRAIIALSNLPDSLKQETQLWIAGDDKTSKFISLANKLGVSKQVKFLGARDDVTKLMRTADLLLHPAYNENTGTVLLEALINGLPVLTTDICGYAVYIKDAKIGKVINTNQTEQQIQQDINKNLNEMLTNDNQVMRESAINYAHKENLYKIVDTIYQEIIEVAKTNNQNNSSNNKGNAK